MTSTSTDTDTDIGMTVGAAASTAPGRRIVALDAARGIAVIGMFIQHFASNDANAAIVSGNTTLLFVLCGGISYSIMSRRVRDGRAPAAAFRTRMLGRAVFIDLLGYLLILLNAPAGVILPAYAGLFVLALLLVRRSTKTLAVTTGLLLLLAPPIMLAGQSLLSGAAVLADLAGGGLSSVALAPAFVVGMLLGRTDLAAARTGGILLGSGAAAIGVAAACAATFLPTWSTAVEAWQVRTFPAAGAAPDEYATWPHNVVAPNLGSLFVAAPHSATTFQTVLGIGAALAVLGGCVLIARIPKLLAPFALVGQVALTLYAGQFLVMWVGELTNVPYQVGAVPGAELIVAVVTIGLAWLLTRRGRGPLERTLRGTDRLLQPATVRPVSG